MFCSPSKGSCSGWKVRILQELEEAGHGVCSEEQREAKAGAQLAFFCLDSAHGTVLSTSHVEFSFVGMRPNMPSQSPGALSPRLILHSIKLAGEINHY